MGSITPSACVIPYPDKISIHRSHVDGHESKILLRLTGGDWTLTYSSRGCEVSGLNIHVQICPKKRKHVLMYRDMKRSTTKRMWPFRETAGEKRRPCAAAADNLQAETGRKRGKRPNLFKRKTWLTKMELPGDREEEKGRWREGQWDTFILCD